MTVDQLVARYAALRVTVSRLRADNQRVWESREDWKRKHAERWTEVQDIRRKLKRCTESRDRWRTEARKRGERRYNYRRNGRAPWHNVTLTESDVRRILRMPVR